MPKIIAANNKCSEFSFSPLQLDEFVPVIQIDKAAIDENTVSALVEGNDTVTLSDKIDCDKRDIANVLVVIGPGDTTIPFKVDMGIISMDDDGCILPKIDKEVDGITVKPDKPTKVNIGDNFDITISVLKNKEFKSVIDYYASDDEDDLNKGEIKDIFCGRINIAFYPDVFTKKEADSLVTEINYLKGFVEKESPSEYAGNYCMAAAERGLSKLLNNNTDFYSVDINHNRLNNINFSGKGAKDRGKHFENIGYAISSYSFNDYIIDRNLLKSIKTGSDRDANYYNAVTCNYNSDLFKYLTKSIDNKNGLHIFYLSVTDDFHTLLLIIDNSDPNNITYSFFDQHGITTSSGNFEDIEKGIAKQTSWTFLLSYSWKGYNPDKIDKTITRIWKIQRK